LLPNEFFKKLTIIALNGPNKNVKPTKTQQEAGSILLLDIDWRAYVRCIGNVAPVC
jgi:hypothetical protein